MEDRITVNFIYIGIIAACFAIFMTSLAFLSTYMGETERALADQAEIISASYDLLEDPEDLARLQGEESALQLFSPEGEQLYPQGDADAVPYDTALALEGDTGRYTTEGGDKLVYTTVPLSDGCLLCLSRPKPDLFQVFSQSFGYILVIFLVLIPLSILFALWMTRRLLRPVKKLETALASPSFDPAQAEIYPELVPLIQEISERRNERESMRQEFTANVSHELKTPLTTISGYSEMIANGLAKPEDVPRFAAQIYSESERMQQLVGDVIELNALDSEVIHDHDDEVDMLSMVQDCMEQLAAQFAARRLSVYVTGEGFSVMGNRRQLWELVYNLLDNARRYNVDGGMIRISVADGVLSVKDTGIGIAPEHQARIFERFYRVDKSHSRATGGTGLGLSIVKHVAELHGATLELDSQENIGTEIRVRFPRDFT